MVDRDPFVLVPARGQLYHADRRCPSLQKVDADASSARGVRKLRLSLLLAERPQAKACTACATGELGRPSTRGRQPQRLIRRPGHGVTCGQRAKKNQPFCGPCLLLEQERASARPKARRAKGAGTCSRCGSGYTKGDWLAGIKGDWYHWKHLPRPENGRPRRSRRGPWITVVSGGGFESKRRKH